jgi:hypothetical protein
MVIVQPAYEIPLIVSGPVRKSIPMRLFELIEGQQGQAVTTSAEKDVWQSTTPFEPLWSGRNGLISTKEALRPAGRRACAEDSRGDKI